MIRKVKICPYCAVEFKPFNSLQPCCTKYECIKKHNSKKEVDKRVKKMRKDRIDYRDKLQIKVQEIARLIDRGLTCLATGRSGQMHGGHVYARGGNSSMALNLHNIHRQSAQSNHFHNDDGLMKEGLENEYGSDYLNFVKELRRTPQLKYSNEQYQAFYKLACNSAKRLHKMEATLNPIHRIILRNSINELLGIYSEEYTTFNRE